MTSPIGFVAVILVICLTTQAVSQETLHKLPYESSHLQAWRKGLVLWTNNGFQSFPNPTKSTKLSSLENYGSMAVSASGRLFGVEYVQSTVRLFEVLETGRSQVYQARMEGLNRIELVSNQTGQFVWLLLFQRGAVRLMAVETTNGHEVCNQELPKEFAQVDEDIYVALGEHLLIAKPSIKILGWEIFRIGINQSLPLKVLQFEKSVVLRLAVAANGNLIVAARNELHQPDSGFVCCLDKENLQQLWRNNELIPYHLVVLGDYLLLTEGTNSVLILKSENGKPIGEVTLGKRGLVRIAANSEAIWGLEEDMSSLLMIPGPQATINRLIESSR